MELLKPPTNLSTLSCFLLLLFTTIIQSFSIRTLGGLPPPPPQPPPAVHHHHLHKTMTFYMPNVLKSNLVYHPPTTEVTSQPLGPFTTPPTEVNSQPFVNSIPSQTFGIPGIESGISFSALNILQEELKFGTVSVIDVDLLDKTNLYGLTFLGKAKGMYVISSESETSHMMSMTTTFLDNDFNDEIRFFGVHQTDVRSESHVAVIGGTGKYEGANGYAAIKAVRLSSKTIKEEDIYLQVEVYLG